MKPKKTKSGATVAAVADKPAEVMPAEVTLDEVLAEVRRTREELVEAVGKVETAVKDGFNTMRKVLFRFSEVAKKDKAAKPESKGDAATVPAGEPSAAHAGCVDIAKIAPLIGNESEVK